MDSINKETLEPIGNAYSIIGLASAVVICFGFRQYPRFLDYLQLSWLWYQTVQSKQSPIIFSKYLSYSWVDFEQNFYVFCSSGDLVCTLGFQLSFVSCLVVFLLFMRLLVWVQNRRGEVKYESIYCFFKGLIRWVYLPMVYWSMSFLINSAQAVKSNLVESIVLYVICLVFPYLQFILYKCTTEIQSHHRIVQLLSYIRLFILASLMAIGFSLPHNAPYYVCYAVFMLYGIMYFILNKFMFRVVGRVLFVVGEILMVCLFSFFVFNVMVSTDLFFISAVMLIDLIRYIVQVVVYAKYGYPTDDERIVPESTDSISEDHPSKSKSPLNIRTGTLIEFTSSPQQNT